MQPHPPSRHRRDGRPAYPQESAPAGDTSRGRLEWFIGLLATSGVLATIAAFAFPKLYESAAERLSDLSGGSAIKPHVDDDGRYSGVQNTVWALTNASPHVGAGGTTDLRAAGAVTAAVITVRGAGPDSDEPGTPASLADYEIRAPIRPVRTAAIDQAISSPTELPAPNDCEHLLTWASGEGTAAVNIGRIDLGLTANRLLQVTVNEVTVAVTKVQPTTAKTLIQCDTADWRKRWEPLPTDRQFSESLAVHRKDYFTEVPVVTLDDP